jgi:hypothetical protein
MKRLLRLYCFGRLSDLSQPLVIFAEFGNNRAVERVNITSDRLALISEKVRALRGFIESGYPSHSESSLKMLGEELFNVVFVDTVKRLFDQATGTDQTIIPIELLLEDFEIACWPWEYLYDHGREMFLCQELHPISRGIFTLDPGGIQALKGDRVRIMVLIGVGKDDEATPGEEVKWIDEVFNAHLASGNIEVKVQEALGPIPLEQELSRGSYDILHFFGHAAYDPNRKEGYLRLDHPDGRQFHFYANEFGRLLRGKGIRLVFLNACETGKGATSENPARSSVAAALLGRGIPAVIATQFSMPDASSHYLSAILYNSLVTGKSLTESLQAGRRAMSYAERHQFFDWGIPVLYSSNPELIVFPRPATQSEPSWAGRFANAIASSDTIKQLASGTASGAPSLTVERTLRYKEAAKVKVALVDIDSKVGFLPDLVEAANQAQSYYHFRVVYLPMPSGSFVTNVNETSLPQMYLPRIESYLSNTPHDLGVDFVCCLTQNLIAQTSADGLWSNLFAAPLNTNQNVAAISTFHLREYASRAKTTYAKATLRMCMAMIVASDKRWGLGFHEETVGCMFDFCENRDDIVISLSRMRFDHEVCRSKIKDQAQLDAIDALGRLSNL